MDKRFHVSLFLSLTLLLPFFQSIEAKAVTVGSSNCVQDVDTASGVSVVQSGTDCIVTFNVASQSTSVTNTWTPPAGVTTARVLVVGGGASGDRGVCGPLYGHGGGGGQVRDIIFPISPGTIYSIGVGAGGTFAHTEGCPNVSGNHGSDSSFGSVIAYGGRAAAHNLAKGGDSGSLAFSGESSPTGGSAAGAGAGAGGPGGVGPSGATNLHGGRGIESNITNSVVMYGSGGAGLNSGITSSAFSGGASSSTNAAANRGGGGTDPLGVSGRQNGAAGVVIIRYAFVATCTPTESRNDSSTVLTFNNVGTCNWQAPTSISSINVLLVGGGGGGGGWVAGGGGGGGVVQQQTSITSGNTYSISVAAGGRGTHVMGGTAISVGTNGGDSTAFGLTAFGGGLGATWQNYETGSRATGGGGGRSTGTGSAGLPNASISPAQGFSGGTATGDSSFGYPTGGGGGAGGVGSNASNGVSGNGGAGRSSAISGTVTFYGGGGGGGCHGQGISPCSNGNGTHGGGNGSGFTSGLASSGFSILGGNGTANTGGGGGGAGVPYSNAYNHAIGGSGGSGVVVISFVRYTSADDFSLEFNGSNQYAYALDNSTFDVAGDLTIQVWVNPASASANSIIVRKELSYQIYQQDGFWYFSVSPNGTSWSAFNTDVPVRANEWHHLAITRAANSNTAIFYYDGVAAKTGSGLGTSANRDSSDPFILGGWFVEGVYQSNWKYQGKMDHLQIYSSVRTQAQIASDMHAYVSPSTSNLRVSYDFNEGTGTRLFNRTSTATLPTDLILVNNPTWGDVKTVDTSSSAAHTIVRFPRSYITSSGGWNVPAGITRASVLVVAGGGAGGSRVGGGGGAGGLVLRSVQTLVPSRSETITVGAGGIGVANFAGRDGGNSVFGTSIIAIGGGGGGASNDNGQRTGRPGGSGGGTGDAAGFGTSNQTSMGSSDGRGFPGARGQGGGQWSAGGGGGSSSEGSSGGTSSVVASGAGGNGTPLDLSGSTVCYAAGGGGGIFGNSYSIRNNAGGCSAGASTGGSGVAGGFTGLSATVNTGSGGGGAGYVNFAAGSDLPGGSGGSGIIVIRWINATAPIFTGPNSDTLTAGLTETFTVTGSPVSPLTRGYRWQVSTDTGTTWTNASTGSGILTANYVTPTLETTTSGIRFQYRVVVTDSDTAGLFIVETSTAVFLTINPRITITGGSFSLTQKYGQSQSVTYTIANGTGSRSTATSPNDRTGITWSSVSGNSATINIGTGLSIGTYYETLTVTDSVSAVTRQMITLTITKADTITVTLDTITALTYTGNPALVNPTVTVTGLSSSDTATVVYNYEGSTLSYTATSSGATCANGGTCSVGDLAPGGGRVFHVSGTRINNVPGISDGGIYLATAPNDWASLSGNSGFMHQFGCNSMIISGVFPDQIGTGAQNTKQLSELSCGTTNGARTVSNATINGYSDWFMPTLEELRAMRTNLYVPGLATRIATNAGLWASIPETSTNWTSFYLASGGTSGAIGRGSSTNQGLYIMPIRAFSPIPSSSSTAPTNAGTYTALPVNFSISSPSSLSNYQGVTVTGRNFTINKARQAALSIGQYNAFVNTSSYPINVYGGTSSGAVTRSLDGPGSAGCAMNTSALVTAARVGTCSVTAVKAGDINYLSETATATIYWIQWSDAYATRVPSTPNEIVLNHQTGITRYSHDTLTVTSYTDTATVPNTITSARVGQTIRIVGTGFSSTAAYTEVNFNNMEDMPTPLQIESTFIRLVIPPGSQTGQVIVNMPGKSPAYGPVLTITP